MGSSGQKRSRKAKKGHSGKPQHMPKVGTKTEERYAIRHERGAVMDNMGVRRGTPPILMWGAVIIVVLIVVGGIVTLIALD